MKKIKTIFISPRGTLSSNRTIGFLMITLASFLVTYCVIKEIDLQSNNSNIISNLIYGGVALVGSTIFENKFKNDNDDLTK
jgi:hypothetical protein